MKTLLSTYSASALCWALRGSCCFLEVHYLTMERATAKNKTQQDVPGVVTGTLSELDERSRFRFSWYREYVCGSVTCPLGPVPGSLLGSFQEWGCC